MPKIPKYKKTCAWKDCGTRFKDLDEWQKREYRRKRSRVAKERRLEREFQAWKENKKKQIERGE